MGKVLHVYLVLLICISFFFFLFFFYNQLHTKLFADVRIIGEGAALKLLVAMR